MKKQPKLYIRSWEKCTEDEILKVPELESEYVEGYENYVKGNRYFSVEHRLTKTSCCSEYVKNCRSNWYGFEIGGAVSPKAVYKCEHGIHSFGLVQKIHQTY